MGNPKISAIARSPLQRLQDAGLVVTMLGGFDPVACDATFPDGKALYFVAWDYGWELKITVCDRTSLDTLFNLEVSYAEYSTGELMLLESVADLILSAIALYQLSGDRASIHGAIG